MDHTRCICGNFPRVIDFLGMRELLEKPLFDPSMMVHFRNRFSSCSGGLMQ